MGNRVLMAKGLVGILGFLILSFQNCSPVQVTSLDDGMQKLGDGPNLEEPLEVPPQVDNRPAVPAQPNPMPSADGLDPREIHCKGIVKGSVPAIVYDSKTLTGSAPIEVDYFAGLKGTVEAETVSSVSNFAGSIKVIANHIGTVSHFAASSVSLNAKEVESVHGFAAGHVEVVTHHLEEARNFAGDFCVSAQSIGSIENLASRLSLYGRNENGQKAQIAHLGRIAGFVSIYDFEVGTASSLSGAAMKAKFVNSHLSKLENAAVDIILEDSVIDEVSNVAGVIHLKGNSKVLKHSGSALQIITVK